MKTLKKILSIIMALSMICVMIPAVFAADRFSCVYTPITNTGAVITPRGEGKISAVSISDTSVATATLTDNRVYVKGVDGAVGVVDVSIEYGASSLYTVQVPIGYTTFRFSGDSLTVYEGSDTKYEVTGVNTANEEYTSLESVTLEDGGVMYTNTETYKLYVSIKKSGGTYVFDGKGDDMAICVKKEATDPAVILLAGLDLTSSFTAPVTVKKNSASTVTITALEGHINTFTDSELNNGDIYGATEDGGDGTNAEYAESAVIKGKDYANITINGGGTINLNCVTKNAVKVAEYGSLTVDGATINAVSAKHGISSDNILTIESGILNVVAAEDGIRTDPSAVDSTVGCSGIISINGGVVTVESGYDCIQSAQDINITGGTFNLISGAGYTDSAFDSSTMSCKGIKASFSSDSTDSTDTSTATNTIDITGGIFSINCPDDGIHSDAYAVLEGGMFNILTADDGVHADTSLTMGIQNGGNDDLSINVNSCYEGLEAGNVYFYSGKFYVNASDDGVNAAGDSTQGFNPGGNAGRPTKPGQSTEGSTTTTSTYAIHIIGGELFVNCSGDGLDANGALNMKGGNVEVWAQAAGGGPETPVDCDGTFTITGGTIFAAGCSEMATTPSSSSTQKYVRSTSSISAGKAVNVVYNNSVYFTTVARKALNYVLFSCPDMTSSSGWSITSATTSDKASEKEEICSSGHDYSIEFITEASTCTESGTIKFVCSVCGDTTEETLSAAGHAFDSEFTVDVEATESANGSMSRHCLCCDEVTDVTEIVYGSGENEEETTVVPGDVNGDGKVNSRDMMMLKKFLASSVSSDSISVDNADVNGDGNINSRDMMKIKKYLNGLTDL